VARRLDPRDSRFRPEAVIALPTQLGPSWPLPDRVEGVETITELGRRNMLLRTTVMPTRNALIRADLSPANL
jgi:hypothetical protein